METIIFGLINIILVLVYIPYCVYLISLLLAELRSIDPNFKITNILLILVFSVFILNGLYSIFVWSSLIAGHAHNYELAVFRSFVFNVTILLLAYGFTRRART